MGDEQQHVRVAQAGAQAGRAKSGCLHPEAVGMRWGDPITEERWAELQGYIDAWQAETDHGERTGPFDRAWGLPGRTLSGTDVFWLAEQVRLTHLDDLDEDDLVVAYMEGDDEGGMHPDLHLEHADLRGAHLERADLSGARLQGTDLSGAHLEGIDLRDAHLEGADLRDAQLEGAHFHWAHLERADLRGANLEGAILSWGTQLKGAKLDQVHLTGTSLSRRMRRTE
jgi:hypothetical protein